LLSIAVSQKGNSSFRQEKKAKNKKIRIQPLLRCALARQQERRFRQEKIRITFALVLVRLRCCARALLQLQA
jgi:hypothetical protein